jgi:hypothetical protein
VALVVVFWISQLIPVNRSNPPVDQSQTIYALERVPAPVKQTFDRSCQNCHSDQTAWPWYSYVAPASWVIAHDVHQARRAMNLSRWGTYSAKKKEERLEDICDQVTNGEMPDPKYALFHRSSKISPDERAAVCQWTEEASQ